MTAVPVISTFGFIDLAGFTALTEAHGDQDAVALLERFEAMVLAALADDGELVKTLGDAAMVRFVTAEGAVSTMRRFVAASIDQPQFPLARAGFHDGPAMPRGNDWLGATVNLAARIAARASGGQVLATEGVAEAARIEGLEVIELGATPLRNVSQPVQIFEIVFGETTTGVIDPVCRMQIEPLEACGRLRHRGQDFWFCSIECANAFGADPDRYLVS
jgi:class 3 adenylate cyclase/YHS domain-containing protein